MVHHDEPTCLHYSLAGTFCPVLRSAYLAQGADPAAAGHPRAGPVHCVLGPVRGGLAGQERPYRISTDAKSRRLVLAGGGLGPTGPECVVRIRAPDPWERRDDRTTPGLKDRGLGVYREGACSSHVHFIKGMGLCCECRWVPNCDLVATVMLPSNCWWPFRTGSRPP